MSDFLRMTTPLYGGKVQSEDGSLQLPFVLTGESVDRIHHQIQAFSPARTAPACQHFTQCGGCQYQMIAAPQQAETKRTILNDLLHANGITTVPVLGINSAEPYSYRNRIRLQIKRIDGDLRCGYHVRTTTTFLPIAECPIAAPVLWQYVQMLLAESTKNEALESWLNAASEVELFTNDTLDKVQLTLLCPPRTCLTEASFEKAFDAAAIQMPLLAGAGAIAVDPRIGPTGKSFAAWGAAGLSYRVGDEVYWISRGGFFQVNRFLLPRLVELVCAGQSGSLAWDLFAGVGLFSRVLARSFSRMTAVEAHPSAAKDLAAALKKLGTQHRAVQDTTLAFLRRAVLERDRPELIVLDPPRAGAGEEACQLIGKLAPQRIVYVSCDPTTLARDWRVLEAQGYTASSADLVDLFPQTFHLETVVAFERRA
ncbi:MAG: RsmD family RNA methyltransferase [Acidobacteriaceae bacterium]|nr:RsmD family RNA methyltransferase [Acidobacteriaceae bacterium]